MRPFVYQQPNTQPEALANAAGSLQSLQPFQYLAGGTTLIDLMKLDVMRPATLVDINRAGEKAGSEISISDGALRLGAWVKMAAAADHPDVKAKFPLVAETLALAASAQLRNMATLGGNVLQRTRCPYFRDVSYSACNKRAPGSGCSALEGVNRNHAIFGASEACIATYPGDFGVALIALDAEVEIAGQKGVSRLPFAKLHHPPGQTPDVETALGPGDMILAFHIPAAAASRRSRYVKIRDRESYEFALVSAGVALDMDGGNVRDVRIALGGLASTPWRAREAEAALVGKALTEASAQAAAEAAFAGATAREHNAFKIPLGKAALVRALLETSAMEI